MKLRTSITAKILAWILIVVSGLGLVGSGILAVAMEAEGFYDRSYAEIREEQFGTYNDRYSARVLEYLGAKKNTNQEYFKNRNFKYGVIEADFLSEIENLDLNDKNNYLDTNFDFVQDLKLEDLHVFQCTISEHTRFISDNPDSLWGYYWIRNTENAWNTHPFEQLLLDVASGIFFIKTENQYYVVPKVAFYVTSGNGAVLSQGYEFDAVNGAYKPVDVVRNVSFGKKTYQYVLEINLATHAPAEEVKEVLGAFNESMEEARFFDFEGTILTVDNWNYVGFYGKAGNSEIEPMSEDMDVSMSSVPKASLDLDFAKVDWEGISYNINEDIYIVPEEGRVYIKSDDIVSDSYYVLSYQENGFSYIGDLFSGTNDVFGNFDIIVGTLYSIRYQIFGILFGCLAVFLAAFSFLCCAAGYRKGQTELVVTGMNRIPLEIYAGVAWGVEVVCILAFVRAYDEVCSFGDVFWIAIMVITILFGGLLAVAAVLEVIARFKLRILWKNTLCYWIISRLFGGCKQAVEFAAEHTSLFWKAILLVGCNAFLDFVIIAMSHGLDIWMLFFVLKNGFLLLLALGVVSQLKKLRDGGECMARGNMAHRVDTNGMFWEFKRHGEHLNSVGEGLTLAVEERMRSEHFKTELITNVSHDIKTPLTSIINYVDLMQKEEVTNPKLEEYLEVLDRQSKRLKKLLEDLLEASKASAGTLQVDFETLEAGVFMVQTVGEFEEKTKALDLELIIKKPEEAAYIRADGRHFWRVIDNLMNNICKYAQPNTRVYINLEATKEKVCITFRNTSRYPLNITSEELKERFVRGDESRHTEGSGLGLSIAQSLVELMHGQFELVVDGDLFKVILIFDRILN